MWKMPDANSNDYTRHFKMDGGLGVDDLQLADPALRAVERMRFD